MGQDGTPTTIFGANDRIRVWGVPFTPATLDQAVAQIDELIAKREPSYVITGNLNYVMLSEKRADLQRVNDGAALMLADGMPIVVASRLQGTPLPERVAGSDLIWRVCEQAGRKGHRVYLLGGEPGIGEQAANRLREKYPGIQIAGVHSPPFRPLSPEEHDDLCRRIRETNPDVLILAFGQPKGELWIAENCHRVNVPVCIQLGASLDFVAGKVLRAPRWIQRIGMEWAFRLAQEPRRLVGRYTRNALFLFRMLFKRTRRTGDPGKPTP